MIENLFISLAAIVVLGVGAQWLAWKIRIPSIILLLIFGFFAGPVTGVLRPDSIFGELLLPLVSISVALILFEGGLSLRIRELKNVGAIVFSLISIGLLITWVIGGVASYYILGLDYYLSTLFGVVIAVTGPTVIIPLLRHIRPVGQLGSVLRWEGILIDPIGAILAVLVFEEITIGGVQGFSPAVLFGLGKTIVIGGILGASGAGLLVYLMQRYLIPDFLQNPVTLMTVLSVYTISNQFQTESGLLGVTLMGIILANQGVVNIKHIVEFKESLRVILISGLFVILAARLKIDTLNYLGIKAIVFILIIIFIGRPLSIILSTIGSSLSWRERGFLMSIAPRGIVAAAISSVFALRLGERDYLKSDLLIPFTFIVITFTVIFYSVVSPIMARILKVSQPNPQGVLIVGAHSWARMIARALQEEAFEVLLIDTNRFNVASARMEGLPTFHGNILSESILNELKLDGIGRLLALTSNEEVNSLAALHLSDIFGRKEVYQLNPDVRKVTDKKAISGHLHGRFIFGEGVTYSFLARRFLEGAVIKKTNLTEKFGYDDFKELYGEKAIPLFLITEAHNLIIFTRENPPTPKMGQVLISLVTQESNHKE